MSMIDRRNPTAQSFLPEDYLQKKAERRAIGIALFLFLVVGFGVVAAFFVTYRQWSTVKAQQEDINREYADQTRKIEQLKVLEAQKAEMMEKAEVTTALIEKVPRSILLAELINRMPKQLTLTEMAIKSKRIVEAPKAPEKKVSTLAGPTTSAAIRSSNGQQPVAQKPMPAKGTEPPPKPAPPKFEFRIELAGLSATDEDVADYHQALVRCPLLDRVEMLYSGETTVDEVQMRKFKIEATIRTTADARMIEPLHVPRLNPRPTAALQTRNPKDPMDPTQSRDDEPQPAAKRPAGKPHAQGKTE